jgi:hypothetical protein
LENRSQKPSTGCQLRLILSLLAPPYSVNRFLVLDGGFNPGLTSTSTRWEIFVGFTYLVPKRFGNNSSGEVLWTPFGAKK